VHNRIPALSAAQAQDVQRSLRLLKFFESGYGIPAEPLDPPQNAVLRALFSVIHLQEGFSSVRVGDLTHLVNLFLDRAGENLRLLPRKVGAVLTSAMIWSDGRNRSEPKSQEPGVVKKEITYESALREEEIDEVFVARKLRDLSGAQGRRWNPKKGFWEKFEDYGTQLVALKEIAKIFGIYATQEDSENENKTLKIAISAIPFRRVRVPDGSG